MTTHAFICSKPFQLVSILNLPYDFQDKSTKRLLFILNHFPGADEVADKLPGVFSYWDEVFVIQERDELTQYLKQHKVTKLYADIDTGKVAYLWSLAVKEVNVYEEGTQNYRSIRKDWGKHHFTHPVRQVFTSILGWGAFIGSNRKTKNIFVYNPRYFETKALKPLQRKVRPLKKKLYNFLEENSEALNKLFPIPQQLQAIKNEKVAIYITAHWLNEEIIQKLKEDAHLYDRVLMKIHPQIPFKYPELLSEVEKLSFEVIHENFLAEIMFMTLLRNGNTITIFHESSTACLYLKETEKVKMYDYRESDYRKFYSKLRSCYLESQTAVAT